MQAGDDLAAVLAEAWARLGRATGERRRTTGRVARATLNARGGPALRTVVLRSADPAARRLEIRTDRRSVKVVEIEADPTVALLLYEAADEVQIRVEGRAQLLPSGAALDAAWADALEASFADRILAIDAATAKLWGALSADRPRPVIDTLLAATAIVHDLTLVTRNTTDVAGTGVAVLNPWG